MQGGFPRVFIENADDPVWSPDGSVLAFSQRTLSGFKIEEIEITGGKRTLLSEASDKFPIAWPSKNKLIAVGHDHEGFALDLLSRKWSAAPIGPFAAMTPSPDGKYIYWEGKEVPEHNVHRTRVADGHVETLMKIENLHRVLGFSPTGVQLGVAPDGSVLATRDVGTEEIYALSVKWP